MYASEGASSIRLLVSRAGEWAEILQQGVDRKILAPNVDAIARNRQARFQFAKGESRSRAEFFNHPLTATDLPAHAVYCTIRHIWLVVRCAVVSALATRQVLSLKVGDQTANSERKAGAVPSRNKFRL